MLNDGKISLSEFYNRLNAGGDKDALTELLTVNKSQIDASIKESIEDLKIGFATSSTDAKAAAENMKLYFQQTANYSKQVGQAIQNSFAQAFLQIGHGGLGGLVASFAKALQQILAQAAAFDLYHALHLDTIFGNQGGGTATGGIFGALGSLFGGSSSSGGGLVLSGGNGSNGPLDLTGYATGGSFQVGGAGGTDSQLVQFMASPDEKVTVSRPGQSNGSASPVIFSPVYNVGSGVSRTDVMSACAATQKATIAQMTKLIRGGAFA
jgi:hypothetical protein